jgi:galactokinase
LVETAINVNGVLGSRMMGGGFGGCTITLLQEDVMDEFILKSQKNFKDKFGNLPIPIEVKISDGAKRNE